MERSVWVVIEQGVEYNDSTYDIAGEAKVGQQGFNSLEEARKAAHSKLRDLLKGFRLCDFDEYYGHFRTPGRDDGVDEFLGLHGISVEETKYGKYFGSVWGLKWDEFIEYCEENGFKWLHLAPELVTIQEIKIND